MRFRLCVMGLASLLIAVPAFAATISGVVRDATGGVVTGARVVVRNVSTGQETIVQTGSDGRYQVDVQSVGSFLVVVSRQGFAEAARTIVIDDLSQKRDVPVELQIGVIRSDVVVAAARSERETREVPLHIQTMAGESVAQSNPLSTGDSLTTAVNLTPVGNGPFGVRPRLRGLDSTRLLVLVDSERLNTARQATERTGAEVGLISPHSINRLEIVNGAGTVMYGSDALAGTINIVTNEPTFSSTRRFLYGFDGYYSTNEQGRRGTATLGVSAPRYAVRVQTGGEHFDSYNAGAFDTEATQPLFASGTLRQADTIDDNFGFTFRAFPDPFNAPYTRTDDEIPNAQAHGNFVNAASIVSLGERRTLRVRYQRRRMEDIGFPDFAQPYFFNATSLPWSNLDRVSGRYESQAVTPWLANLSVTAYYQRTERMLKNVLPVQFPAPTPTVFFPISVMRLSVLSETEQRVWTPGVDVQAVLVPKAGHRVTAGMMMYRDRSSDQRTTTTTTSMVGQVVLGQRGPAPVVFPSPVQLGPPSVANPVRVPDATLRDIAMFVQDEWRLRQNMSLVASLRGDFYRVATEATPGYNVSSVVSGANPPIDPATLPDPAGAAYSRNALTGDVGLVANTNGRIRPFIRIGRSYRHPNLEEMLFAGPATIGSLAPNVTVGPETGVNFDTGATFTLGRVTGGAFGFVNQYDDFIAQDLVVATTPSGPLAQATNYADVRISGVELSADAPLPVRYGVITLSGGAAFTHGTITRGTNPLDGTSLDGTPADNITPFKGIAGVRFTDRDGLWWVEYGLRSQSEVTRVATTLLDSPFIIAQDLLSLDGFTVQRIGWGLQLLRGRERLDVTFAVENLTNACYREQFQFAPARGRSFTVGIKVGAF